MNYFLEGLFIFYIIFIFIFDCCPFTISIVDRHKVLRPPKPRNILIKFDAFFVHDAKSCTSSPIVLKS